MKKVPTKKKTVSTTSKKTTKKPVKKASKKKPASKKKSRSDEGSVVVEAKKGTEVKVTYKLNYGLVFGDRLMKQFGKYSYNTKTHKLTIE